MKGKVLWWISNWRKSVWSSATRAGGAVLGSSFSMFRSSWGRRRWMTRWSLLVTLIPVVSEACEDLQEHVWVLNDWVISPCHGQMMITVWCSERIPDVRGEDPLYLCIILYIKWMCSELADEAREQDKKVITHLYENISLALSSSSQNIKNVRNT